MAEFTIGAYDYKSLPMDAMTQFKVARRLAPALSIVTEYRNRGSDDEAAEDQQKGTKDAESTNRMIEAAGKALGALSDEATDYILAACLGLCQRRAVGSDIGWAQVWNKQGGRPNHTDVNMAVMLQITIAVLKEALGDFFLAAPSS